MTGPSIGAIVLAAGLSSRMGCNKLLLPFKGKPLVRHAVEAAVASHAHPVIVVTGNDAFKVTAVLDDLDVHIVENVDFSKGLSTSLKCGLRAMPPGCAGAVVLLGDMPLTGPEIVDSLIAAFDPAVGRTICVPVSGGRRGNPVLLGRKYFGEIQTLEGDVGARQLLVAHQADIIEVSVVGAGPLTDIDTPDDLAVS
jgi:molybdenum cofactor cytidylyltransferase